MSATSLFAQQEVGAITDQTAIGLYLAYAGIAVALVVFLARTLYRNGAVFLRDVFDDDDMATSVNHLLVVGFYLLNLGYALLLYRVDPGGQRLTVAFNELIIRLGMLLLSLGVIHLVNMLIFWRIRNHRDRRTVAQNPPAPTYVAPAATGLVPPPPGAARV